MRVGLYQLEVLRVVELLLEILPTAAAQEGLQETIILAMYLVVRLASQAVTEAMATLHAALAQVAVAVQPQLLQMPEGEEMAGVLDREVEAVGPPWMTLAILELVEMVLPAMPSLLLTCDP